MIKVLNNEAEFETILKEDANIVIDFNATWCGPCRMMGRVLHDIEADYPNITFLKVDTDAFPRLASAFSVYSIPALFAVKNGKHTPFLVNGKAEEMIAGALPEEQFRAILTETF